MELLFCCVPSAQFLSAHFHLPIETVPTQVELPTFLPPAPTILLSADRGFSMHHLNLKATGDPWVLLSHPFCRWGTLGCGTKITQLQKT